MTAHPPTVAPVDYDDAGPEVRAIFDEIMAIKGIDAVPNFWRTIAHHPPLLRRTWESLKQVMAPGALDPLTKEMIALAVSATNGCEYCIRSHTAAARRQGMSEAMLGELMAVVALFQETNLLAEAYQVPPDDAFLGPPQAG